MNKNKKTAKTRGQDWWVEILVNEYLIDAKTADAAVRRIIKETRKHLIEGGKIRLKNLGSIESLRKKEREFVMPNGTRVGNKNKIRFKFTPSQSIKEAINQKIFNKNKI